MDAEKGCQKKNFEKLEWIRIYVYILEILYRSLKEKGCTKENEERARQ